MELRKVDTPSPLLCAVLLFAIAANSGSALGVHFYRTTPRNGSQDDHARFHEIVAEKQEVKEYVKWLERVRNTYERDVTIGGGFPLLDDAQDMPIDRVYSTLKMQVEKIIKVSKEPGEADFQSIQAAIDSVPKNNVQRTIIQVAAGRYVEKVKIPKTKPYITLIGAGMNATTITWDDTAATSLSTLKSATFSVMSLGFVAKDIAFENTAPPPPPGAVGRQAVAFQISGDHSALYNCAFLGAQDTLYDHKGRHFFKDCWIQGSIDFIFGDGLSLYESCVLYAIDTPSGSLTAQKRKTADENTGFAFLNCTVTGTGLVLLGRAWGAYSRVVYLYTHLDVVILPGGWNDWGIPSREK
ncbi:hypothetical protein KP509_26G016900 [Ceratopteris richardii]|nr:hypothetical protein KP509_26G016900 [Ceratopteris richardii]